MKTLVNDYLALWNERDDARRATAIAALLTEDSVYSDPDYAAVTGPAELNALVARAHEKLGDLVFTLGEIIGGHHDQVLFTWHVVPPAGGDPVASGYDVAELVDGRIRRITGFFA
jgi:hypothetical protein